MKKILLPTDFSPNAWNAISYALKFYKDEECKFFLLHTYSPPLYRIDYTFGGPAQTGIPDKMIEQSLTGLTSTLLDVQVHFPNKKHSFESLHAFNILTDEINEVVQRENIKLIIMGTKGATAAAQILFGTNAVFVMRKATVPVLAIPEGYTFRPINNILFPTDFMTSFKKSELQVLLEITKNHKANIKVLHINEEQELSYDQENNKKYLTTCLKNVDYIFAQKKHSKISASIDDYINTHEVEILVMMNRKHSFLERLLFSQNVESIGFNISIPFLAIRDSSRIYN